MSAGLFLAVALVALVAGARPRRAPPFGLPPLVTLLGRIAIPERVCSAVDRVRIRAKRPPSAQALDAPSRRALSRARVVLGGALGLGVAVLLGPLVAVATAPLSGLLGAGLVDLAVHRCARSRADAIRRALPDTLDLLAVSLRSGLSVEPALRAAAEGAREPLASELNAVLDDIALGVSRADAYRTLAVRSGTDEVRQLGAALTRAHDLGAPPAETLADLALSMRLQARDQVRERAARAAPKIQLVVALVMVPGAVVLVLGVLILELVRQVGGVIG